MCSLAEYEFFKDVTTGSPAFRHGALLIASIYHALWRGVPVPAVCHSHSALTIGYVNSSLETVEGQTADGTLAAIACLAAFEVTFSEAACTLCFAWLMLIECCQPRHKYLCPHRWDGSFDKFASLSSEQLS
jgi:hypothetical protein